MKIVIARLLQESNSFITKRAAKYADYICGYLAYLTYPLSPYYAKYHEKSCN